MELERIPLEFLRDPDTVVELLKNRAHNTRTGEAYRDIQFKTDDLNRCFIEGDTEGGLPMYGRREQN